MKEHGICAKCKKSIGCPYADDRITGCKNFVLEPELKLTNEESLRQCNTEQLAEFLTKFILDDKRFRMTMVGGVNETKLWLKQPHTPKE